MKRTNRLKRSPIETAALKNARKENHQSLFQKTMKKLDHCADVKQYSIKKRDLTLLYFPHLIDEQALEREVLSPLKFTAENDAASFLRNTQFEAIDNSETLVDELMEGCVILFYRRHQAWAVNLYGPEVRSIRPSETETTILGNHDAFIESLYVNLSLIRRRLKSPKLKVLMFTIGDVSRSDVAILYIEGLVDEELLERLTERITEIDIDIVTDAPMFVQLIDDHPYSFFPQYLSTERPDIVISHLSQGKMAGFIDNSPVSFIAPANFFDFFHSPDDLSQRWLIGSATRLMRFLAFLITLTFTAFYVAVTTFHYEMIPESLLISLAESRNRVPFTPLIEALLMEGTLELLREAGARLPTKIGQTIGIVGGIVIGQAAVQAGLVSNTLIIAVAISAIASFVMPSYLLSAALRIARFGLIFLAGILGNFGLIIGVTLLLIHLSTLSNLSTPYFNPLVPLHPKDLANAVLRLPFWRFQERSNQALRTNKRNNKTSGRRYI
ncbi:GerA spore germination protein [Alteribacillus persepolensis]|uniref:GerA spore germination protein n=1 Tax=Alteribacillus persepolensis TaxID=568899 RepID=A0A1G8GE24_9BACI|nr:spore germination protein [Alteribacillus persepolensis]SDH92633.1 GerA spore germination protein [Alteribacillus persepolensis]